MVREQPPQQQPQEQQRISNFCPKRGHNLQMARSGTSQSNSARAAVQCLGRGRKRHGFVEIASIQNAEEAACMWKEFIDFSKQKTEEGIYEAPCRIEDGSRLFIGKNQAIVIFSGEKFVDYAVGAGAFIYNESFECGNYTKRTQRHSQILRGVNPNAFADPIFQYTFAGFDKSRFLEQTAFSITEEEQGVLAEEFENAFEKTLIQMRDTDIDYNAIPYKTEEILGRISAELDDKWGLKKGISAKYMKFAEICPSEESLLKMLQIRRSR